MKKIIIIFLITIAMFAYANENTISDKATAIKIAKTHWYKVTGEAMDKEYPLEAYLNNDVWLVTIKLPDNMIGGGATVEINAKNGKILKCYVGQ